ncbi:hypothetical protein ACFVHB_36955 [Kitasatospora sp. NPDC127111]|uniref:hypothetical protein n=1 Tax=Kitasatospora sp. NPDC127111 TaxID=3345363 RepID=UPI003634BB7E
MNEPAPAPDAPRATADRIRAIEWRAFERADAHVFSRAALLEEYFRRAALWLDAHGEPAWWPFFDLAAVVAPSVRADPALIAEVEGFIDEHVANPHVLTGSVAAVHWAALREARGVRLDDPPDPFEPLIRFYERGGIAFRLENGFVDLGVVMVPRGNWRQHLAPTPVVELDDRVLDTVDAEGWARLRERMARR